MNLASLKANSSIAALNDIVAIYVAERERSSNSDNGSEKPTSLTLLFC